MSKENLFCYDGLWVDLTSPRSKGNAVALSERRLSSLRSQELFSIPPTPVLNEAFHTNPFALIGNELMIEKAAQKAAEKQDRETTPLEGINNSSSRRSSFLATTHNISENNNKSLRPIRKKTIPTISTTSTMSNLFASSSTLVSPSGVVKKTNVVNSNHSKKPVPTATVSSTRKRTQRKVIQEEEDEEEEDEEDDYDDDDDDGGKKSYGKKPIVSRSRTSKVSIFFVTKYCNNN